MYKNEEGRDTMQSVQVCCWMELGRFGRGLIAVAVGKAGHERQQAR
jgi:hypothetical protein